MARRHLHTLIHHLRQRVCPRGEDALSDAQLPARWIKQHDDAAFEVPLWRHGAAVISSRVAALVEAAARGTAATKLRWTVVLGLMLSLTATGAGAWIYRTSAAQPPSAKQEAETEASKQPPRSEERSVRTDRYGDPLPEGVIARLGTVRLRHVIRQFDDLAASPDGKMLATRGEGGIRLWSMTSGQLLRQTDKFGFLKFSPDGKLLATNDVSAQQREIVCFLDTATGRVRHRLRTHGRVLAFSPDGKQVVIEARDKIASLWEIETGRRLFQTTEHKSNVCHAVFTNAGRVLLTTDHTKAIYYWDIKEGKLLKCVETKAPSSRTFRLSPDGRTLAVVPYSREAVRLYDTESGKVRCELQGAPAAAGYGIDFSADSRILSTEWDPFGDEKATISLWDANTGKPLHRFQVHANIAQSLRLAPDGKTVLTTGGDAAEIYLWDSASGQPRLPARPAHSHAIKTLAFTPDSRQLLSCDDRTLRLWQTDSGRHLRELAREARGIWALAILPDGSSVLSGGYLTARLRQLPRGQERHRFALDEQPEKLPKRPFELPGHFVRHLGFSCDGRKAACISYQVRLESPNTYSPFFEVHLWDVATGRLLTHRDLGVNITLLGFTPGATATIECIRRSNPPQSSLLTQFELRAVETGKHVVTLSLPDTCATNACAVSPDGRTLVTATVLITQGKKDIWGASTLRFWELASGKERQTIRPPQRGWESSFAKFTFASDGRTLATARSDRTLQLWDAVSGKEWLRRSGFDSEATALAFAPDGRSLATGHGDSTILLWDTAASKKSAERRSRQPDAKQLEQWWSDLGGDDAHAAWIAIWKMATAPRHVLPLLRERLKPAQPLPADEVNRLIDLLDNSDFVKREAASKRLAEMGERVLPALEKALKAAPSLEKRRRIENLLPTSEVVRSLDVLRAVRAIEVLEHIGTAEAQQILKTLTQGMPQARITREAKAALERLTTRQPSQKENASESEA